MATQKPHNFGTMFVHRYCRLWFDGNDVQVDNVRHHDTMDAAYTLHLRRTTQPGRIWRIDLTEECIARAIIGDTRRVDFIVLLADKATRQPPRIKPLQLVERVA